VRSAADPITAGRRQRPRGWGWQALRHALAGNLPEARRLWRPQAHPDPLFVLGNQKSGTTAIAALLASAGGLTRTLDLAGFSVEEQDQLHDGSLGMRAFVRRHPYPFSSQLVKEPALTFLFDSLIEIFPCRRAVFIVRDPRDNIRSILDRTGLPGDLSTTPSLDDLPAGWRRIVDNRWLGLESEHYIESLAERWNLAMDIYHRHAGRLLLVRYEDFLADKRGCIEALAHRADLRVVHDVSEEVDLPYQPPGDASASWLDGFGRRNLERIERICGERMHRFGYRAAAWPREARA
jgi:hypothetical protein